MRHDWSKCQSSKVWGVLVELVTDVAECRRKVASGRNDAGTIRSFNNG